MVNLIHDVFKEMFTSNSLIKTYTQPYEVVPCAPVTVSALLLHYLPGTIQCSLLYPFLHRFPCVRRLRWALTPLSLYYSLKLPVDYCFTPTSKRGYPNMALACASFVMLARSIEWATLKNYQDGKFFKRPEYDLNPSDSIHKIHHQSSTSQSKQSNSFSFQDWLGWTLEMVSSVRGQQFEWGMKIPPYTESAINLVKRMYMLNIIHVFATGFSILCRDHGSATNAIRYLGLPAFYGDTILAEGLQNLAFGFYLITMIELGFAYMTLLIHLINFINSKLIKIPNWFMRCCDLKLFSPLFNNPQSSNSLVSLWGKAWHQMFRQSFLTLGGFPATNLTKKLGFNHKVQRLAGMFGCFVVSAALHEYAIHFAARQPHSDPHIFYHEFPGSFIYFILQPIGILIEPYIIPYIPGGGIVWGYAFTLLTVTPFRRAYFKGYRFVDKSYPTLHFNWFLTSFLLPCSTSLNLNL